MVKIRKILVTPTEACKFRVEHTTDEIDWAKQMADIYSCFPLKSDGENFYTFVADVFYAGRISGCREVRQRRGSIFQNADADLAHFEEYYGKPMSDGAKDIVHAMADYVNEAYNAGMRDGRSGAV